MRRTLHVYLGESTALVGTLRYDAQGARESTAFEYAPSWLEGAARYSIDPGLALVSGAQFHRRSRDGSVFAPAIADTEPDGWARRVIQRDHAKGRQNEKRRGAAPQTRVLDSLDYLLAVDDVSRVGALRFREGQSDFLRAPEEGRRTAPPFLELGQLFHASRAVETNAETARDLAYLRGRGTSLGGLRPKCTLVDERGVLSIGKFPSVADERKVTHGEVLALRLARKAGIDAAKSQLVDSEGVPVAVIERFDRAGDGRLMFVSAATMIGAEPSDPREHAYTELVDALRQYGASPQADIEELWRRIAFSILITNVDDHLMNHGFLHVDRGQWRLSPAFDLNPFPERARELKTWISEDAGPEATVEALMSVTAYFGLKLTRARVILGEVVAAVARWRREGKALGMNARDLEEFAPAFEHPERAAAKKEAG